jgi:hypothetical protein
MARYCFYCGRELGESEKCHCRERSFASSTSYTSAASQQSDTSTEQTAPPPNHSQTTQQAKSDNQTSTNTSKQKERVHRPSWNERRAKNRAKKEAKQQAKGRESQNQRRNAHGASPYRQRTSDQRRATHVNIVSSIIRFFAAPALHMTQSLSTVWTLSHTIWLAVTVMLSGILYFNVNRFLSVLQTQDPALTISARFVIFSWLTGIVVVFAVIVIFTLTIWLIARFLYRQHALPFRHTLAVGKVSWQYMTLFFALSLPSIFSHNPLYGIVLALMGLVFSVLIHARQVTALTHLDDNRKWQFMYLSIIMFTGVFSTIVTLSRFIPMIR